MLTTQELKAYNLGNSIFWPIVFVGFYNSIARIAAQNKYER